MHRYTLTYIDFENKQNNNNDDDDNNREEDKYRKRWAKSSIQMKN